MFSVIIPTYNRPLLLEKALQSARGTQWPDLKIIVVDDCSPSAETETVCRTYHAQYVRLQGNSGPGIARQTGLLATKSRWAILLDDDDELRPDSLVIAARAISSLEGSTRYPCIQFAHLNASLDCSFKIVSFDDYLHHRVKGDFTSIIQVQRFISSGLSFPSIRIGGEHLLWYRVAREFGIPSWTTVIAKIGHDAPNRLCSAKNQLQRPAEYACLSEATLEQFGKEIRRLAPARHRELLLGAITYNLLAGKRRRAASHIWTLVRSGQLIHASAAAAMTLLPRAGLKSAFRRYRRGQLHASPASY
jgi:glycosyltransferase involved in cell wall biosynthesis